MHISHASPAPAAELDPFDDGDRVGGHEVWAGADATARTWLAYTGATMAPWGDTHADGLRVRTTAGYGGYRYAFDATTPVSVRKAIADLSIGYQMQVDDLTLKVFAGWAVLAREADKAVLRGNHTAIDQGVKLAAELWFDVSEHTFAALDLAYADTRAVVDARLRIGHRIDGDLSIGPELTVNRADLTGETLESPGREHLGDGRFGLFVRYEWFGGEVSAAGGVASAIGRDTRQGVALPDEVSPYGALNVLMQF